MARLEDQLKEQIAALQDLSSVAVHERNIDALLAQVLAILHDKMGMRRGTFTLRNGEFFEIAAARDLSDAERQRGRYQLGEGITGAVGQTGKPQLIPDISLDKRFRNLTGARAGQSNLAFICVPVFHLGEVIGTLSADRQVTPEISLDADLRFLEIVGNLVAEAVSVARADYTERQHLLQENRRLRQALGTATPGRLIGNSGAMREVYELIRQVAPSDATVLIRGNTGTGKELAARAIYELSPRAGRPLVALNCGALPENLIESELFGHEKGAFTGAVGKREGRVEMAHKGVLFLDEIGDLVPPMQVKLLRFLQEHTFSRIGSNIEMQSDVRLIAATHRNLEEMVAQGTFRDDLYYRLNIFPITLPDLCQRRSDIILLADHFVKKYNARHGKQINRLSTTAINLLMSYHWPGNVRELENCIERAALTATDDCIHSYNLPPSLQMAEPAAGGTTFGDLVDSYERDLIIDALKKNQGNMSAAGRELSLSPRVMHYKINRLKIRPEIYQVRAHKETRGVSGGENRSK
ncbi:MAG: sigma 54-interacting transcriptional regulator [Planctomycetota bacterium]|jgi:Nif-specific regulatory protein|nr:sigma 54-interacting transcriptional regulator [Planctomycetota bacterium]